MTEQTPPNEAQEAQTTVVTRDRPLDPSHIMQLATGYWESAALFAANEIGLFAVMADGSKTAGEVAESLQADQRGISRLLDACCGLNLLAKQGDHYILPSISAAFLVPGSPGYLGNALRWAQDQYAAWGQAAQAARTGQPVVDPALHLGEDPTQTETFVLGMHDRAMGVARGVVPHLDMEGCKKLLDVGGGPGTYSMLLARKYPTLQATVLDLPATVAIAQQLITQNGLSDRVGTLAGDATFGDYGEDRYDAVLFSGVLHQMSPVTITRMLEGAHRALTPGGHIFISDIMVDATKTQPVFATLFSLQMLLASREGAVFAVEECQAWLHMTHFHEVQVYRLPPPLPYTILSARK